MGKPRHVIIGNSAAGLNAAKAIRSVDTQSQIAILGAEKCFAYSPVILLISCRDELNNDKCI